MSIAHDIDTNERSLTEISFPAHVVDQYNDMTGSGNSVTSHCLHMTYLNRWIKQPVLEYVRNGHTNGLNHQDMNSYNFVIIIIPRFV